MTNAFKITPLDTLMFRDGRPFNQQDEGASAAESLFPPPPPTLVGAIRLGLALQNGFSGNGNWPANELGNGVNWQDSTVKLGQLSFGPLHLSCNNEPLYPAPLHLAQGKDKKLCFLTLPEEPMFRSDMGDDIRFAQAPENVEGVKTLEGHYVTREGMEKILKGELPACEAIIFKDQLFRREARVGIGIDEATRITDDGNLYIAQFARLNEGVEIIQPVDGLNGMTVNDFTQRLGGEHRRAHFEKNSEIAALPCVNLNGSKDYIAIALSPVFFDAAPKPGDKLGNLPGKLVSACMAKPFMLGGWDSRPGSKGPLPMRQIVPAGAVFFMEIDNGKKVPTGVAKIGVANEWGFGHCLIGKWPQSQ